MRKIYIVVNCLAYLYNGHWPYHVTLPAESFSLLVAAPQLRKQYTMGLEIIFARICDRYSRGDPIDHITDAMNRGIKRKTQQSDRCLESFKSEK